MQSIQNLEARMLGFGVMMTALLVLVLLFGATDAFATAGPIGDVGMQLGLNSSLNLGDVRYSMYTTQDEDGRYGCSLDFSISCGVIGVSSIEVMRDQQDPLRGIVYAQVYGLLDVEPSLITWRSQFTSISRRGGLEFNTNVGVGSWQDGSYDESGTYTVNGEKFSSTSLGATLSNVSYIGYSSGAYHEYDEYTYEWTNWDGETYSQFVPAKFIMDAHWNITFQDLAAANTAFGMMPTSVPEPTTMAFLVIGAMSMIARRRHRQ